MSTDKPFPVPSWFLFHALFTCDQLTGSHIETLGKILSVHLGLSL